MTDDCKAVFFVFLCFLLFFVFFFLFCFFFCFFVLVLFCFLFGGFFLFFFNSFLSVFLIEETVFHPRKGHFLYIFECLPLFLLSLSLASPLFNFSFSVSLYSSFLSFLLLVFLFCFLVFGLFLSVSFFFAFVSWKEQHENIQLQSFPSSIFSLFFGFLSCFLFETLFLIFVFPDFKICFLFSINVLGFIKPKLKNANFGQMGVATNVFYLPVICKMWRGIICFFLLTGPSLGSKKEANLDQLITIKICVRNFLIT